MRRSARLLLLLAVFALVACGSSSEPAPAQQETAVADATTTGQPANAAPKAHSAAGVRLATVGRFDTPVYVTAPPGDTRRVFVVQQGGAIRVVRGGRTLRTPFLDVSSKIVAGGEQGLLSMAFAPDYAKTGLFYVYYTEKGTGATRVVEYRRANADRANAASARLVLAQDQPESNHNGGLVKFGPDGLLYVGLGDGGGANDQHSGRGNAQNLGTALGKLLRIDPRRSGAKSFRIPASNPFVGRAGARGEVYAYGLRNPWRFSFDRSTGDLVIGDVGQNAIEEVDFVRKGGGLGANFGWRPFEGKGRTPGISADESAPNAIRPVIELRHDKGYCSVTGGYIVRDPKLPALRGRYVYGDFCEGHLRAARLTPTSAGGDRQLALPKVGSLSSFGEDALGRVYVTSLDGPVYRLAAR